VKCGRQMRAVERRDEQTATDHRSSMRRFPSTQNEIAAGHSVALRVVERGTYSVR